MLLCSAAFPAPMVAFLPNSSSMSGLPSCLVATSWNLIQLSRKSKVLVSFGVCMWHKRVKRHETTLRMGLGIRKSNCMHEQPDTVTGLEFALRFPLGRGHSALMHNEAALCHIRI